MKPNINWKAKLAFTLSLLLLAAGSLLSATIGGTITNENVLPVGGAQVQLTKLWPNANNHEMVFRTTMTNPAGAYLFNDIPDGDYHVSAIAPDYVRSFYVSDTGQILVVEIDADDTEVVGIDIQLIPQNDPPPPPNFARVSGFVYNLENAPLPNLRVGVVTTNNLNAPLPNLGSFTNQFGHYMIQGLQPGTYKTCVLVQNLPVAWSAEFTAAAGTMTDSINIFWDAPPPPQTGSISGNVIGIQNNMGVMINVGLVTLDDSTAVLPNLIGHVGNQGHYMINHIPVGAYRACVLGPEGAPIAYSDPVTVIANQIVENVDIIVGVFTGYSISGTIYGPDNQPLHYGVVVLRSANNPGGNMHHMFRTVHVDSLGAYIFHNIPAGQYILSIWTHLAPVVFYPSTFNISEAQPVVVTDQNLTGINITIPAPQTYTISGYVKDAATQAPLPGIKVRTDRMGFHHFPVHDPMFNNELQAVTDATGYYSITAPAGHYTLAAVDTTHYYRIQFYDHVLRPFQATVIDLNTDLTNINFDLIPREDSLQCRISGTVTADGEAITYPVLVVAVSSDEDWEETTVTNAAGSYTLNHLRPGNYYVVAYSLYAPPTYYDNALTWEDADLIPVNGPVNNINFNLISTDADGPANLSGTITDGSNAISNVIVMLTDTQNQILGFARTDAQGYYEITNAPAGNYTVIASKLGFDSVEQPLVLDQSTALDMVLGVPTANSDAVVPALIGLVSNYPNPFNPNTTVFVSTAKDSRVAVRIYNSKGQLIRTLLNSALKAGTHTLDWNGTDESGRPVSSGVYLVRLQGEGFAASRKMTLMK